MKNMTVPFPVFGGDEVPMGFNRSSWFRHLTSVALANECEPSPFNIEQCRLGSMMFSSALHAKIEQVAAARGLTFQQAFAGLAVAGFPLVARDQTTKQATNQNVAKTVSMPLRDAREGQARLFKEIMTGLRQNMDVMAEASTGIGKSRVITAVAIQSALDGKNPIIIAVPTLANLAHAWTEFKITRNAYVDARAHTITATILPGASEFVDDLKLRDYLESDDGVELKKRLPDATLAELNRWIELDAKLSTDTYNKPLVEAMTDNGYEPDTLRWLMDDLKRIVADTDFPFELFRLRDRLGLCDDMGVPVGSARKALAHVRHVAASSGFDDDETLERLSRPQIILCTHAMVATITCRHAKTRVADQASNTDHDQDAQDDVDLARSIGGADLTKEDDLLIGRRGDTVPWRTINCVPRVLLIDEAHQFENAVANVRSESLSLSMMRLEMDRYVGQMTKGGRHIRGTITLVDEVIKQLRSVAATLGEEREVQLAVSAHRERIIDCVRLLHERVQHKSLDDLANIKKWRTCLSIILENDRRQSKYISALLSFSEVHACPSFQIGPNSVGAALAGIWNDVNGGTVFISATLFTPDNNGSIRCKYISGVLNTKMITHPEKMHIPAPIESDFLYESPLLMEPARVYWEMLSFPRKEKDATLSKEELRARAERRQQDWARNIARTIFDEVLGHAVGGTLVLCTSYDTVNFLHDVLTTLLGDQSCRLIRQISGHPLSKTVEEFKLKHREGLRPVLIGCGSCGTGLDIRDELAVDVNGVYCPQQDTLLTDLVITRLPISLNQTSTFKYRRERYGSAYPILQEVLLTFRQWLGRLVRAPGQQHRKIWILDGRLYAAPASGFWTNLQKPIKSLLVKYKRRDLF